jgi:hypothetical protein
MGGILDNFRARGLLPRKVTRFTHPLKDNIALKTRSRCNILFECGCFTLDTPDLAL